MVYENDRFHEKPVRLIHKLLSEVRKWKGPDGSDAGWWCPVAPTFASAGGDLEAIFVGHTGSINSVAYSKEGKMIASASNDGTIRVLVCSMIRLLLCEIYTCVYHDSMCVL